jgi:primary-amine oxidase
MPCEIIKVALKPVNFFDKNPALDVAPSQQSLNQSTLLSNGNGELHKVNGKAECCS